MSRFPGQVVSYIKYTLDFAWSKWKSGSAWLMDEMLRHLRIKILELWGDVGRLRSGSNVWAFWGDIETFKEMLEHLRKSWNIWEVWIWEFGTFETILSCLRKFSAVRVDVWFDWEEILKFEFLGQLRGCMDVWGDVWLLLFINERLRNCWTVQ